MNPTTEDLDSAPRADRLTDGEVEANREDREFTAAMELASAERVADACPHPAGACAECIAAYAQQLRETQRNMRESLEREQAEIKRLREVMARLEHWTHEFGAALKPPGADSYGEGMRDAKEQIANLLRGAK